MYLLSALELSTIRVEFSFSTACFIASAYMKALNSSIASMFKTLSTPYFPNFEASLTLNVIAINEVPIASAMAFPYDAASRAAFFKIPLSDSVYTKTDIFLYFN